MSLEIGVIPFMATINKSIQETSPYLPTLSTRGWVTGINEKVDRLFSYYVLSQYNQTVYHLGHVKSLQYTAQLYGNEPNKLADTIRTDLTELLRPFIDNTDISVEYAQRGDGPEWDYTIHLTLMHAGYKWTSFKSLYYKDSKFEEIVNINNTGVSLVT